MNMKSAKKRDLASRTARVIYTDGTVTDVDYEEGESYEVRSWGVILYFPDHKSMIPWHVIESVAVTPPTHRPAYRRDWALITATALGALAIMLSIFLEH